MNKRLLLYLISIVAISSMLLCQKREFELPESAKTQLSRQFGNWKYSGIKILQYDFKAKKSLGEQYADLTYGDFNGDGKKDYAAIIVLLDSVELHPYNLIVLFCKGNDYDIQVLDVASVGAETNVYLVSAGEVEEDLETHKKIKYKCDAIGYGSEKASATIYFENGQAIVVGTGD